MAFLIMARRIAALFCLLLMLPCVHAAELTALVYHDVAPDPGNNPYSVSRTMFVAQMDYLKQSGFRPISLGLLQKVKAGKARLPDKAILLTFDDALRSYSEFVVPTLKRYGFPSVVSVVTAWAGGADVPEEYRGQLLTWEELKQIKRNPLVEIISHSHDLHHGIPSNPQGNENAAGTTRRFDKSSGTYETEAQFRMRIRQDMARSVAEIRRHLDVTPLAIAWPYGNYDQVLIEEMSHAGIDFCMTMDNGPTPLSELPRIRRIIVRNTPSLADYIADLEYKYRLNDQRAIEFRLDPFKGVSTAQQEELLSSLLNRLQTLHANTVILSPFTADHREAFFYNKQMPVTADVLNRTLHQILKRLQIRQIYLRLPATLAVADPGELYADLARLNWFSGVIFESLPGRQHQDQIRHTITYYRPGTRFGAEGMPSAGHRYDFSVVRLDSGLSRTDIEARAAEIHHAPSDVLVLVGRQPGEDGRELAMQLRRLRGLGIRHFGYGLDDYVDSMPVPYTVASEMNVRRAEDK